MTTTWLDIPSAAAPSQRRRLLTRLDPCLAALSILFVTAAGLVTFRNCLLDDGMIVLRVVRNLLAGHGWVYNLGEARNVLTSALHPALLATLAMLRVPLEVAPRVVDGAAFASSGALVFLLFRGHGGSALAAIGATFVVQLLASAPTWGLETNLFVALLLLAVWLDARRSRLVWAALGALALTRPDGLLFVGVRWLAECWSRRVLAWRPLLWLTAVLAPWLLYFLVSFDAVLPATLHSKMWQGASGFWGGPFAYLRGAADHMRAMGLFERVALVLAVPGGLAMVRRRDPLLYVPVQAVGQQVVYALLNVAPYRWYFTVFDVAVLVSALYAVTEAGRWLRETILTRTTTASAAWSRLVPAANLVALTALVAWTGVRLHASVLAPPVPEGTAEYRRVADAINAARLPPGALAAVEVGTLGFRVDRPIVDLTGLTSENPEYLSGTHIDLFFARAPMVVVLHRPPWVMERALVDDPRFALTYGTPNTVNGSSRLSYVVKQRDPATLAPEEVRRFAEQRDPPFEAMALASPAGLQAASERSACHVDYLNGMLRRRTPPTAVHGRLSLEGWAIDWRQDSPPSAARTVLAGSGQVLSAPAALVARPDVAKVLGREAPGGTGVRTLARTDSVPAGRYRLWLWLEFPGSRVGSCDTGVDVEIRPGASS